MSRVAVIGAGISGIACAQELINAGHEVVVFDRGIRLGGRLAAQTLRTADEFNGRIVDVGASYPTARDPEFIKVMNSWIERGLAREWTDTFHVGIPTGLGAAKQGPMRYCAPKGLRSLVEDLADQLPAESVTFNNPHDVESVLRTDNGAAVDGATFDAVVLAMPDPQAKRLLDPSFKESHIALRGIAWEAVLSFVGLYDKRTWPDIDGVFVNESTAITWIADDGKRRGDNAPVLVAHSNGLLAQNHLENPETARPAIESALKGVLGIKAVPRFAQIKRWTYARPLAARPESFHFDGVVGLCGDAWHGGPRIETAWLSGRALGNAMGKALRSGQ